MHYFIFETASDGSVYSCDKICITGKIGYHFLDTFSSELSMFLISSEVREGIDNEKYPFGYKGLKQYSYYERFGIRFFRNNFELLLTDESSFYFAYEHNSSIHNNNYCTWKFELNPNKCLPCEFVTDFINFIIARSKPASVEVSQIDIAIDLKVSRFNVYLEKDQRTYTRIDSGTDRVTEYLSKHNENGFVKVYNKGRESDLSFDLTRIEITLKDLSYSNFESVFPQVHVCDDVQISFDDNEADSLSQNDQIFLNLLLMHPDYLHKLTFRKQKKFKPFLDQFAPCIEPDIMCYVNLIERVRDALNVSK